MEKKQFIQKKLKTKRDKKEQQKLNYHKAEKILLENDFKCIIKKDNISCYIKETIKQPVFLIKNYGLEDSENNIRENQEVFDALDTFKKQYNYNKKIIGVIFNSNLNKEELLTDPYYFLKITPDLFDVIPLYKKNIRINFKIINSPQERNVLSLSFDPYKEELLNLFDLLKMISSLESGVINYGFPVALKETIRYFRYFTISFTQQGNYS